jgi:hypothetical protein
MKNIETLNAKQTICEIINSKEFLDLPKWSQFFYTAKDKDSLIDFYEFLIDDGFEPLEQPHYNYSNIYVAKLMNRDGKIIYLRSK